MELAAGVPVVERAGPLAGTDHAAAHSRECELLVLIAAVLGERIQELAALDLLGRLRVEALRPSVAR